MSVLSYLKQIASEAVLTGEEEDSIKTSISTLRKRLYNFFYKEGIIIKDDFMFGSYMRETILPRNMDNNSDIDYMIIFKDALYEPQTYINRLKKFVENSYSTSEIYQSRPSVVLELNHIKFDLVPAVIKGLFFEELYIPNNSGGWQSTDAKRFNNKLTEKNKDNKSLIKPAIRLVKYWNAVNDYIFESYLLEKRIVKLDFFPFFYGYNLRYYFFKIIESLDSYGLSELNKDKIKKAKNIVADIKHYEIIKDYDNAEALIQKLIP